MMRSRKRELKNNYPIRKEEWRGSSPAYFIMLNIYNKDGWVDMPRIISWGLPFTFVVDTRGSGKTYGILKDLLIDNPQPFIYMRRIQTQLDACCTEEYNPLIPINSDFNKSYNFFPIKKTSSYTINESYTNENGKLCKDGGVLALCMALSTIKNLRGFSGQGYRIGLYDEFIPEPHDVKIKEEGFAFRNAFETINRNRELKGEKSFQMVCCANSDRMANPMFTEFGLISKAMKMIENKQEYYINKERGICLIIPQSSPIAEMKKNTALYKVGGNDEYNKMALGNVFLDSQYFKAKPKPLKEYRPIVHVGELTIYKHKSNGRYYASTHTAGACPEYKPSEISLVRFKRDFAYVWLAYLRNKIDFEEYLCEVLLTKYFE